MLYLLDLDGVLIDKTWEWELWRVIFPREYAKRRNISEKEAIHEWNLALEKEKGTLRYSDLNYWSGQFGFDIMDMHREHLDKMKLTEDAANFLGKCKGRKAILSDCYPPLLRMKVDYLCLTKQFPSVYSSFDFGLSKTNPELYRLVLEAEGVPTDGAVFVDNSARNVIAAEGAGIKSYLFKGQQVGLTSLSSLVDLLKQSPAGQPKV